MTKHLSQLNWLKCNFNLGMRPVRDETLVELMSPILAHRAVRYGLCQGSLFQAIILRTYGTRLLVGI
jgi:hypothetical protein